MTDARLLTLGRRPPSVDAAADNLRQLVQLRWLAVVGQLVTILIVRYRLGVPLPVEPMVATVAALAAVNLVCVRLLRRREVTNWALFLSLVVDVGALTVQLYLSGGATNPFAALYLLQVVLGAILLEAWSAWVLVVLTGACFALLTAVYRPLRLPPALQGEAGSLFLLGEWLNYGLIAVLLVLFIGRIGAIIRQRDRNLAELRRRAAEEDGIVRMGLLASGAAHELGTPLASLSVILGDWRRMPAVQADPSLMEEVAEAQAEVERCKAIVTGVLASAGEPRGLAPEPIGARAFLEGLAEDWRTLHEREPLFVDLALDEEERIIADPSLRQAVWNLLENAREASPGQVTLAARREDGALKVTVLDRGEGFAPDLLASLGRPLQSSKGPGHGVGLFLTANVARKLGGRLDVENRERGAAVTLTLPLATIGANEASLRWTRTSAPSSS
ncbi:ATP-binding protein [Sphingomonas lenta]|uniref:histidine kinase n=1 Tax=Sphingomonas lenta TaxID=1141887 RepID=A0A2A2SF43_9SPHN|nr:ATP-binding protein [Sphingomonas lenta]PAX07859.1 histidine kinase [Sphingomonas lenta]